MSSCSNWMKRQTVDILVDAMTSDPFLIVSFVGASEDQVVFDDDSGGGTIGFNAKVTYLAPHSGTYIAAVSDTPGAAIGSYYLSVSEAPDGAEPTMIVPESTIAEATTYVLRQFIVEEGKFELEKEDDEEDSSP